MELRLEFVTLAMRESANISALCRRFGISRTTGYTMKTVPLEERSELIVELPPAV